MTILPLSINFKSYSTAPQNVSTKKPISFGHRDDYDRLISDRPMIRVTINESGMVRGYTYKDGNNKEIYLEFNEGTGQLEAERRIFEGYEINDSTKEKYRYEKITDLACLERDHRTCVESAAKYFNGSEDDFRLDNKKNLLGLYRTHRIPRKIRGAK